MNKDCLQLSVSDATFSIALIRTSNMFNTRFFGGFQTSVEKEFGSDVGTKETIIGEREREREREEGRWGVGVKERGLIQQQRLNRHC